MSTTEIKFDPAAPHTFPRRIFLAVTGLSPQIVTETLYALAIQERDSLAPFVPTEIHLITTEEGLKRAQLMLFEHEGGRFHALCREYEIDPGTMVFGPENIHVVPGADGAPLADIVDEITSAALCVPTDLLRNNQSSARRPFSALTDCSNPW